MQRRTSRVSTILLITLMLPFAASAQWAAQPGETVRNGFGPTKGESSSMCRGACGLGCPSSCKTRVSYECLGSDRLTRVKTFICSTHQGCRDHDNCLDQCAQDRGQGFDCETYCHGEAVETHGIQNATSWAAGGGPFDGPPIFFQYTREAPDAPDPAFRCPEGSTIQCGRSKGTCFSASGDLAEPIFDSYPSVGADAMRVAGFKSGPLCDDRVCGQSTVIRVTGDDLCERGQCTKYGVEFDYRNADPSAPLECTGEVSGGGDFVGNVLKKGADMIPQQGDGSGEDGMAELIGMFQKVLDSADTPEDVQVSMAPLDEHGNPIESERVGQTYEGPASVPRTVPIPAPSGRLVVPMYQLTSVSNPPTARHVRCSHKGVPVLEVDFQLQYH